jgi:large subunit ribosomal protein L18
MATGPKYVVKFRRVREGKTDFKKRLALLKSKKARFAVRFSNKNVICQVIAHGEEGDRILAAGMSKELIKLGWDLPRSNASAAYLTGYLCGKKAKTAKVSEAVFDIGFKGIVKGSNLFAALKGAVDAGLQIPHDASIFPTQDRIDGAHKDAKYKAKVAEVKKKIDSI